MMQQTLGVAPSVKRRAKSVYQQRNLGTIRERKKEKRKEKEAGSAETIMRILRMRYVGSTTRCYFCLWLCRNGTSDFISHQLQIMATMQAEQEQRARDDANRKLQRPRQNPPP